MFMDHLSRRDGTVRRQEGLAGRLLLLLKVSSFSPPSLHCPPFTPGVPTSDISTIDDLAIAGPDIMSSRLSADLAAAEQHVGMAALSQLAPPERLSTQLRRTECRSTT